MYICAFVLLFPGVFLFPIQGDYFDRSDPSEEPAVKAWEGHSAFVNGGIFEFCTL